MVGGNPQHDVFGFRNWDPSKVPGTPFVEYFKTGSTGRFMGFIACVIQAAFTVCGPEYLSMTAGEVTNPRATLPRAFRTAYLRLATFFVGGAICMGILVPYNDPALVNSLNDPAPGAGSSIYVIAMKNMGINGLSHVVNVLIMLSVFSAGNSYMYCASRSLFGLALEGKVPGYKLLRRCTKDGVPIYCVGITLLFGLLAFMQVSSGSAKVLGWFVDLVTASTTLNYAYICLTYIRFYQAIGYRGIGRDTLPFKGPLQPFCAYYALFFNAIMTFIVGYTVFLPGNWDTPTFVFSYFIIIFSPVCFIWYKIANKTKFKRIHEITFFDEERKNIDEYESSYVEKPARNIVEKCWRRLF
ncbi:general amino acid permease agp2 [Stygiomarasmius scandens]|uniref:General amino acid permease agp2 n=1 Tax=Marasmiellus scandens TaxID=2682957 RepID=A0ABR1IV80_9AGAR